MSELSFAPLRINSRLKRCILSGNRTAVPSDEDLRSERSSTVVAGPGKFFCYDQKIISAERVCQLDCWEGWAYKHSILMYSLCCDTITDIILHTLVAK